MRRPWLGGRSDLIHQVEIKRALRFHEFPIERDFDCVAVQRSHGGPRMVQIIRIGCARIVHLPAQHKERLAVHDQLVPRPRVNDLWNRGWGLAKNGHAPGAQGKH